MHNIGIDGRSLVSIDRVNGSLLLLALARANKRRRKYFPTTVKDARVRRILQFAIHEATRCSPTLALRPTDLHASRGHELLPCDSLAPDRVGIVEVALRGRWTVAGNAAGRLLDGGRPRAVRALLSRLSVFPHVCVILGTHHLTRKLQ